MSQGFDSNLIRSNYLNRDPTTVFPRIVSVETILFWKWNMWKFSYSFRIMTIFYFINWIVAAEIIEGGKLFKGGNYSRKYGIYLIPILICFVVEGHIEWISSFPIYDSLLAKKKMLSSTSNLSDLLIYFLKFKKYEWGSELLTT